MSTTRRTRKPKATTPAPKAEPKATPKPKPAPSNCGCGCGKPTITAKATFLAGHDARHAGVLGRSLAATPTDEALVTAYNALSAPLKVKVDSIRLTEARRLASKTARETAKQAAKAAFDAAMAEAGV